MFLYQIDVILIKKSLTLMVPKVVGNFSKTFFILCELIRKGHKHY